MTHDVYDTDTFFRDHLLLNVAKKYQFSCPAYAWIGGLFVFYAVVSLAHANASTSNLWYKPLLCDITGRIPRLKITSMTKSRLRCTQKKGYPDFVCMYVSVREK